jgi:proton-dependent oligopeptide transporter, POT family
MSSTTTQTGHPRGLYLLFFTEMWERFSYYGMRAIFVLFMTKALFLSNADASNIYGSFTGLVYLTPLLGGYIADRYWGNRKSIFVGGILMAIGQILMFFSGSMVLDYSTAESINPSSITLMWAGLTFLIIGNGFFKPNISTMVGQLYPKGDSRIDAAFTIFYMGINLGAFFSPLICGTLAEQKDMNGIALLSAFKWGFLAAGIGMIISVISFELLKNKMLLSPDGEQLGMPKQKMDTQTVLSILGAIGATFFLLNFKSLFNTEIDLIGYVIYASMILMPAIILFDKSLTKEERERILVIFILAFFVIFFWACFEQAGASLTIFADKQTDRMIGNWEMPASWFQSINPLAVILLAPIFSILWGSLAKRNREPSSPLKMAIGLGLVSIGFMVIAYGVHGIDSNTKIAMYWLFALYIIHTMGELSLSPIGLSMVSKLAPLRFSSLLMGTWFLANAAANKFTGTLSALIPPGAGESAIVNAQGIIEYPSFVGFEITNLFKFFCVFIVLSGSAAILLVLIYKWLEKRMHGIK